MSPFQYIISYGNLLENPSKNVDYLFKRFTNPRFFFRINSVKKQLTRKKQLLTYFRPFDYVFIGLAIMLSFVPAIWTVYQTMNQPQTSGLVAIVKINGEVVDTYPLEKGGPHKEKTYYPNKGQYNIVEVDGDSIRVKEDNSPDQIAVKTGWINKEGQLSICLPHNLIIEIQRTKGSPPASEDSEDDLILPL